MDQRPGKVTLNNQSAGEYASLPTGRQAKLYNCGSFINFMSNIRFHLRKPLQYTWKLGSKCSMEPPCLRRSGYAQAGIKFSKHTHLPPAVGSIRLANSIMKLLGK